MKDKVELDEYGLPAMIVYADGYIVDFTTWEDWMKEAAMEVQNFCDNLREKRKNK